MAREIPRFLPEPAIDFVYTLEKTDLYFRDLADMTSGGGCLVGDKVQRGRPLARRDRATCMVPTGRTSSAVALRHVDFNHLHHGLRSDGTVNAW